MQKSQSKKILAIATCFISILIGLLYLILITFLDARGPMIPPPSEAFGEVAIEIVSFPLKVLQLFALHF